MPQASYAEYDSPQLSEDDDPDDVAADEGDGEEYMARAALGLRTKPRKVPPHGLEQHYSAIFASMSGWKVVLECERDDMLWWYGCSTKVFCQIVSCETYPLGGLTEGIGWSVNCVSWLRHRGTVLLQTTCLGNTCMLVRWGNAAEHMGGLSAGTPVECGG